MTQPTPSQNAFDLLKSGGIKLSQSQKQTGKKRRASADQQDKYATCPVCGLSVPKAFIELHASDCLVKPSQRPSPATPAAAGAAVDSGAAAGAAVDAGTAAGATAAGRSAVPVPASHATPAPQQHQQHLQQVDGAAGKPPLASGSKIAAAAADASAAPNAFAIMAAAQAAQVPLDASLFLESRSDGSWACHWWSEGTPCPQEGLTTAWSATINAVIPKQAAAAAGGSTGSSKGPDIPSGSTKLRLQIATNLPSGFGAAVDWSNEQLPSNHRPEQQQQQQQQDQQQSAQVPLLASNGPTAGADAQAAAGGNVGASSSSSSQEPVRWRGGVSVLISALQKCIRRGKAASATRLGLYLLKEPASCEALLRRLSIICLEDGLLHPQLPLVVWAMLAVGKGYNAGGNLANALLAITHQMAAVQWRDFLPDADSVRGPAAAAYQSPRTWQAVDALLPPTCPEALLVRAMLIRAAYGGMEGDKEMLLRFSGLWLARFSGTAQPPPELPQQQQQQGLQLHTPAAPQQQQQQQDEQATRQDSAPPPQQQQQQQQPQAVAAGLPGRKGPASFEGAAAAGSPWLTFLRSACQDSWQGVRKPSDPKAAPVINIMLVGPLLRDDIPLAAVDFHVAPGLTEHLLAQQQLQAAIRAAAATSTPTAAQLTGLGAASLVNSTLWLFRSSYNRKGWLQERYQQQQQQQQQAGGYAQQVLAMELDALGRWAAGQRDKRKQLQPLWRVMALMADAWSREHIQKRLT